MKKIPADQQHQAQVRHITVSKADVSERGLATILKVNGVAEEESPTLLIHKKPGKAQTTKIDLATHVLGLLT
ncbi:hypothetical protein HDU87_006418 [Geranomyces variabilis]|uniref:Uncharacterized protein n=1 Tax=Geranomyces variabilis TaxID=109894 RepID=A0AAD5THT3_9FUNG|nr:hypothetical protein HDU87_006418 [Geranomyces variabilis]